MKKALTLSIIIFVSIFLIGTTLATAGGKPFEALQKQIDELREQLNSIQLSGGIKVFDESEQYLGLFMGYAGDHITIFVPDANGVAIIDSYSGYMSGGDRVYFSSEDCSPPAHAGTLHLLLYRAADKVYRPQLPGFQSIMMRSFVDENGDCRQPENPYLQYGVFYAEEIPREKIPFNLPVLFPLTFVME